MDRASLHQLNFTHLRSFWAAAQEGSIAGAARRLHLSQPTISEQVRDLEKTLGVDLLERHARGLEPSPAGEVVLGYADAIFGLARQLGEALADGTAQPSVRLRVGVAETVPKRIAWRLIEPALRLERLSLECREDDTDRLLADLAVHRLDLVLSDAPLPAGSGVRGFNHLLGESSVAWFALPGVVPKGAWPARLDGAKVLLPADGPQRRRIDDWCETSGVRPRVVAEFQDTGLLKAAGGAGAGAFPAPAAIATGLERELGCEMLGQVESIRLRYYAISPERRLTNPAVVAITRAARAQLEDLA
jgi:LysR family transcriptional activator of nhaA